MTKLDQHVTNQLKQHFNYNSFREGQKEIIMSVLQGNDVLGILKTGSGKSLCYQLPAKLFPGMTIVVSPLISLMIDQVREAKAANFKGVVALHSFQQRMERNRVIRNLHEYKLVYVSPELLQQKEVLDAFKNNQISLFVVDEAHCISQWGYDFRPDYLRLSTVIKQLGNPTILALTGTATEAVRQDIGVKLNRQMVKHIYPMDRENISLVVQEIDGDEEGKTTILESVLESYNVPTIIYFSSRKMAEFTSSELTARLLNRKIAYYHGGMDTVDRLKVQQQFMNDQLHIICCTSAFGMGINKKNIRLVIHYHLPTQLESYIQEIGRAGRDGKDSVSLLLYRTSDIHIPRQIIENELPLEVEIKHVMNQLYQMHIHNRDIPTTEESIEQLFQMNETKWKTLLYQFESHGMINNNRINYDHKVWQQSLQKIIMFCTKRLTIKRGKLNEMIHWAQTKTCLRQHLYEPFQQSYQVRDEQCCSNCGFSFSNWQVNTILEEGNQTELNWEEQLASLLLIGEDE